MTPAPPVAAVHVWAVRSAGARVFGAGQGGDGGAARTFPRRGPSLLPWEVAGAARTFSGAGSGHLVGTTSGAHRVGSLGAAGTYSRAGPEGSVSKPAHRAGGCVGPLGPIPRRGSRPPNRPAEPPELISGSGSVGLQLKMYVGVNREGHSW